jgi:hypothetical protein
MPPIDLRRVAPTLRIWLTAFDQGLTGASAWAGGIALAVLIVSGEVLGRRDFSESLVSIPFLRGLHLLAGGVLLAVILGRIGGAILRLARLAARGGRVLPAHPALQGIWPAPGPLLLALAFWATVGLLVLSGLERYWELGRGLSPLPWLSAAEWSVLHGLLSPYLYAILLLIVVIRGRMALKRAFAYLYRP